MVESGQTAQWWSDTDEVSLTDESQGAGVQLLKQIVLLFAMHLPALVTSKIQERI